MAVIKEEEFVKGLKIFFPNYIKGYRDRVNKFYFEQYEKNKAYFPLMNNCLLKSFSFKSNPIFVFINSEKDDIMHIQISDEEEEKFNNLSSAPKQIYNQELYKHFIIEDSEIIKQIKFYSLDSFTTLCFHEYNHESLPNKSYTSGEKEADEDLFNLELISEIKKVTKNSSSFPLFDVELIFDRVNEPDFKYELEESIKAYNSELYLASVVTAAVSLETLLKLTIAKKLGNEYLPKEDRQKHTLNYAKILLDHNLIDERLNHRIRSLNELRRGGAHSKSGKVEQWDAEQMISGIKIIVESLF